MKITIDVDCTPLELRSFFGLPDVEPLQKAVLAQMQERAQKGLTPEEMETLMRLWMTGTASTMESFQKAVWASMKDKRE